MQLKDHYHSAIRHGCTLRRSIARAERIGFPNCLKKVEISCHRRPQKLDGVQFLRGFQASKTLKKYPKGQIVTKNPKKTPKVQFYKIQMV